MFTITWMWRAITWLYGHYRVNVKNNHVIVWYCRLIVMYDVTWLWGGTTWLQCGNHVTNLDDDVMDRMANIIQSINDPSGLMNQSIIDQKPQWQPDNGLVDRRRQTNTIRHRWSWKCSILRSISDSILRIDTPKSILESIVPSDIQNW